MHTSSRLFVRLSAMNVSTPTMARLHAAVTIPVPSPSPPCLAGTAIQSANEAPSGLAMT